VSEVVAAFAKGGEFLRNVTLSFFAPENWIDVVQP
jgi:hypothetical protein